MKTNFEKKVAKLKKTFLSYCTKNNVTNCEFIQLDNLDEAKLVLLETGEIMVENEHGTQFEIDELSETEINIFYYNL